VEVGMSVKDIDDKRENIEMRCPMCGGRMLEYKGIYRCPDCEGSEDITRRY
jgi:tRNA(Ile2) C34 agmatinyltransferase TiaS